MSPRRELILADYLDALNSLPDNCADMVFADLPYGTTKASWDTPIDLSKMWEQLYRVCAPGAAMVFTAVQPFSSVLVQSNIKRFKHEWIWDKVTGRGHLVAKKRPMQQHESVLVFCDAATPYHPQMVEMEKPIRRRAMESSRSTLLGGVTTGDKQAYVIQTHKYPKTIQTFGMDKNVGHPTQKPVALVEYLIRTYSNVGDVILDPTAGSGTTAVAATQADRGYICIENSEEYFKVMEGRVK